VTVGAVLVPANTGSARAPELARRVTGDVIAGHAGLADIDALIEFLGVEIAIAAGDARPLLVGVLDLPRTGRKAGRYRHLDNEASQLHGAVSGQGMHNALGPPNVPPRLALRSSASFFHGVHPRRSSPPINGAVSNGRTGRSSIVPGTGGQSRKIRRLHPVRQPPHVRLRPGRL